MVFDACACLKRRKTLKSRILQSSQAVLLTNNATIGTQNKTNKTKYILKNRHSKINSKNILLLPLKKKKRGEKRGWFKRQNHQLNTMQKNINRVHTQITRSQSRAHHITRGEPNEQISKHQEQQETNQKRLAALPIQYTSYREGGREGERTRERRQSYRRMQEMPVHMERHRENTHMTWRTEWTIHPHVQIL